ncbi:MAG: hypothetical protein IKQ86_07480 [Prevotella sp.]|nr:hypothetical protein [Prevotella sp.]
MKKELLLLFSLFLACNAMKAQDYVGYNVESSYKKWFVKTPEVASLFYNTAYPVNYSTGTVDINIPLYEVQCGDLILPIYLSYNSTGIKINEPLSWVGQNWTLHAEPQISFIPHGNKDKTVSYELGKHYSYEEVANMSSYIWQPDYLPDEYLYSLLNKTGKYIKSPSSNKIVTFPHDDIKISEGGIIDVDGTKYIFSGGVDNIQRETSQIITCRRASEIIAANGVDKLNFEYNNNRNFSVNYHSDNIVILDHCQRWQVMMYPVTIDNMYPIELYHKKSEYPGPHGPSLPSEEYFYSPVIYKTMDGETNSFQVTFGKYDNAKNTLLYSDGRDPQVASRHGRLSYYIRSARISKITGSNCTVNFEMDKSDENKNLKKIQIIDNSSNTILKTIEFYYRRASNHKRDFLTTIKFITSTNGTTNVETIRLDYNGLSSGLPEIPDPGTRSVDFWGYLNLGVSNNDIAVPQMKVKVTKDINPFDSQEETLTIGSPNKRGANEACMLKGMLKSITYPTGATSEFVFESNRAKINRNGYYSPKSEFHIVDMLTSVQSNVYHIGGLRIKEIITKEKNKELNHRTFVYGDGITRIADGVNYFLRWQTKYYSRNNTDANGQQLYHPYQVVKGSYSHADFITLCAEPIIPITFPNGSPVLYNNVTEYNGTLNNNAGKTVYTYCVSNISSAITDGTVNIFPELYDTNYLLGSLASKKVYKKENSSYKLMQEETYSYTKKDFPNDKIQGCQFNIREFADYDPYYLFGSYTSSPFELIPSVVQQHVYSHSEYDSNNNKRTVNKKYQYDDTNSNLLTSMTTDNSDQSVTERYYYPKDMANSQPYNKMLAKNIISPVVMVESTGSTYLCQKIDYGAFTNKNGEEFYKPSSISKKYTSSGQYENVMKYNYDKNCNVTQITEKGITSVYIWSYNGQYPIACISNCTYEQLTSIISRDELDEICNAKEPTSSHWTKIKEIGNLIMHGKTASITTYTYKPLIGVTSIADANGLTANGVTKKYEYDGAGRLIGEYLVMPNGSSYLIKKYKYNYANQ